MLGKLAFLFLIAMAVLVMVSARPRPGDLGWRRRLRLSLRRLGLTRQDDD